MQFTEKTEFFSVWTERNRQDSTSQKGISSFRINQPAITDGVCQIFSSTGSNLLAGRALTLKLHPFLASELGDSWNLEKALHLGLLPLVWGAEEPKASLEAYIGTYLREEVLQERLVRNLDSFSRCLEVMSCAS